MTSLFFFNDTATTEIYTLSLHDALPICGTGHVAERDRDQEPPDRRLALLVGEGVADVAEGQGDHGRGGHPGQEAQQRSEEHTSELQSRQYLVCRLLLEKKKNT